MDQDVTLTIRMKRITRKKVFAETVSTKQVNDHPPEWKCCNICFRSAIDINKHTSIEHGEEIQSKTLAALKALKRGKSTFSSSEDIFESASAGEGLEEHYRRSGKPYDQNKIPDHGFSPPDVDASEGISDCRKKLPSYSEDEVRPWLPIKCNKNTEDEGSYFDNKSMTQEGQVLLFYKYVELTDPPDICEWQKELCRRLHLNGKIRIAREGLNGTVGGALSNTQKYIEAVMSHPCFTGMKKEDFKTSQGGHESFPGGLIVSLHQEIVPMGVDPKLISFKEAGSHLTPTQFHEEVQQNRKAKESGKKTDTVFIDCRNFYESRIGAFPDAITPDIRKFSYWPEYVDKNEAVFADKKVLMYCTGGIRCERGSAYLRSKGICKEVFQLEGGIHKYLDRYPDGFFRGKLFVFDNRFAIQTNRDVIAECFHCSKPWDEYQPCSSEHCHQLVLSCLSCRTSGLTTCCQRCAELALHYASDNKMKKKKEECNCTKNRVRIPVEILDNSSVHSASSINESCQDTLSKGAMPS
ncbi:thiosulfate sulfurtransferase/rhodanese-like domain-containing protein 2 [Lytechinus pictus]|uniref:thiosulfate sulfurtransferase/rhodanese-like domain-containing protein 2 n=1 Tax=Lytechinus pictus TaxID=7653 RepID=UPI0030BA0CD5